MEEEIKEIIEKSEILKRYYNYDKADLQIIRNYINFHLMDLYTQTEEEQKNNIVKYRLIKSCLEQNYDYLTYMLNMKNDIETSKSSVRGQHNLYKEYSICQNCKCKNCIKSGAINFIYEIRKINKEENKKIKEIDVIDYFLERKPPEFKMVLNENYFDNIDPIYLMYVQLILEADFMNLVKYDVEKKEAEFTYLDSTTKTELYYSNVLHEFYKNGKTDKKITINIDKKEEILNRGNKQFYEYIYILAAYYKYLMEIEKIDIITALRKLLVEDREYKGIKLRSYYYNFRAIEKVKELPYSQKNKDKILDIFNYILNYRYKPGTPYIPINILIYSNDKQSVETIEELIGEYMWFFGYLPNDMKYYSEFMNNIILDKYAINRLYKIQKNDKLEAKRGILLINNFENILYTDSVNQNLILNILTDEMERNNYNVCTIIYGSKDGIRQILSKYPKLGKYLINLELETDELNIEKVYEILIKKLEITEEITEEAKTKLLNYIKSTYYQSENKDMEFVNKMFNLIILNQNRRVNLKEKSRILPEDIPDAYNVRDLPDILKELNEMIGLNEIKTQINDLVYLLKFNQKANLDISKFNLHMIFTGNPGTGKTTVARLISDILYNLGYINQNKLVEVSSKDLIAEYVGQTAGKTYNVIKSALGGVLFIDEAYAITGEGMKFGDECISTILKMMEDYRDKLIIIFAGYKEEMQKFASSNVGLNSRIGYTINFPDYTLDELVDIFKQLLEKNGLKITEEALNETKSIVQEAKGTENFGNARYINNMFQKVLISHAKNTDLIDKNDEKIYTIIKEDIEHDKLISNNYNKRKIGF